MTMTTVTGHGAPAQARAVRLAALWSASLILLTTAYFQTIGPGWNVASRFDLALALGERATFRIDDYQDNDWMATGDKAVVDGHFYSDKSPVTSLAGAPIVWIYRQVNRGLGVPFRYEYALWLITWVISQSAYSNRKGT